MRTAASWAEMYGKHVASLSVEELEAFAAAIQVDAVASWCIKLESVASRELEDLQVRAGDYPATLFQG